MARQEWNEPCRPHDSGRAPSFTGHELRYGVKIISIENGDQNCEPNILLLVNFFTDHPLVSDLPGDRDFMLSIFPKFILFRSSSSCKSHQGVQFAATLRVQRDALNRLPVTHICGVQYAATKDDSGRVSVSKLSLFTGQLFTKRLTLIKNS